MMAPATLFSPRSAAQDKATSPCRRDAATPRSVAPSPAHLAPPVVSFRSASPSAPKKEVTRESCTSDMKRKALATRAGFKRPSFWVMFFGWSLAICAGFVNVVSFRRWGLFVSHVTGATAAIGLRIEGFHHDKHDFDDLGEALWLVFSFLLGAFTCGLLIDKNQVHFLGKAFYGSALVGNALLLLVAALADHRLTSACFASAACGLQNAMCTSHFGAVVRTTHVTGTVTDIGSTLGRMAMLFLRNSCRRSRMNVVERAEVGVDARKLLVLGPMWVCFLFGCISGAYVENSMQQYAFLVPAALTFIVGASYMFFRQTLKEYIKGLEKARLNSDLHDVQEALAHTKNRLHSLSAMPTTSVSSFGGASEEDLVIELDEEMGHMMEALHEVEADVENLCAEAGDNGASDQAAHDCPASNL
eukprot:gb/GFBE01080083.1/.p1 GENE.gb/GFBE01080083.1/~~gb/GFBE01080083.1/.p1  ORF type:complete len:416 (+),score=75.10 gb/GFBE01080083.1/:1-1248(+)